VAYALAPSLVAFRSEVNARWPQRDKTSDGWIGDAAHSGRVSDHNPGARDLVHAFDTDEDLDGNPADGGPDAWPIVAQLIENRDPRVKYLIYEGRIISGNLGPSPWQWRPYTGTNAHRHHVHLSILSTVEAEQDTSAWLAPKLGGGPVPKPVPLEDDDMPYLTASRFTGVTYHDGAGATWISSSDTVNELRRQGVPVFTLDANESDARRIVADRAANTDELTLDAVKTATIYAAATAQIEEREEQRDLADG
jgi:hypothetical protein